MVISKLLMFVLLYSIFQHLNSNVSTAFDKVKERKHIRDRIMKNYKKEDRPKDDSQTNVVVYMKVLAINSVSVTKMEYSTDIYLRQEWIDGRLAWNHLPEHQSYNSNIVSPSLKDKLWLPDLFFRNGKEGYVHMMTQPNYLMRLSPNGLVLYSQKITMRFACEMKLETFPMDTQYCDMNIGSYGYTFDQMNFEWRLTDAMVMSAGLQISEFNPPDAIQTVDCTNESTTSTGKYTCIKAIFKLERQLGSHMVGTFVPSILIVMVSWLNFWIDVDSAPARVTLGLATLLGMLTQAIGISSTLPRVSYIKAIDIWVIACIVFVICALFEYAFASTISLRTQKSNWENDVKAIVQRELINWCTAFDRFQIRQMQDHNSLDRDRLEFCHDLENLLIDKAMESHKKAIKIRPTHNSIVDAYSQFLFPASFLFCNCFFWLYYLKVVNMKTETL